MPHFPRRAARLRRAIPVAVLACGALALPGGAQAADSLGAGGVVIPGSALAVGVSGAANTAGSVGARFSAVGTPLFWGINTSNMNDGTASIFALNTPSGLYSPQSANPVDNAPFTQTQAPALTGTGTAGDPYVVVSKFDANAGVHITQTISHVSGTTRFTGTWAVTNGTGSPSNFIGFEGADLYVNANNNGTGTMSGSAPNRVIGSVAADGTQAQIVEQSVSPFSHYFSGEKSPFYALTGDSTYGYLPDTIDPTTQNSGEGAEWDFTLANGATKTLSVVWSFTHPSLPQPPRITGGVPAQSATTNSTSASPAFTYAVGDAANAIAYQCAIDGGAFSTCTSPKTLTGLAEGSHTFSVRATNSAGDPGPQTDRTFTVDTTPPGAPTVSGAPAGAVNSGSATITLTGEPGATLECSVDGGAYVTCTSPVSITGLSDGNHSLAAKQIDAAGNAGTAVATASWSVDTSVPAAPATSGEPAATTTATTATVAFTTPAGMTAECALDGGAYQACTSPVQASGLAAGAHSLAVRMVNAAGTPGAVRTVTWEVRAPTAGTPTATAPTQATPSHTITPQRCVSRRSVAVHWALPKGARVKGFKILVNGKTIKTLSARARSYRVSLAGRAAGIVKVQVRAIGSRLSSTRTYQPCATKPGTPELHTVLLTGAHRRGQA